MNPVQDRSIAVISDGSVEGEVCCGQLGVLSCSLCRCLVSSETPHLFWAIRRAMQWIMTWIKLLDVDGAPQGRTPGSVQLALLHALGDQN